MKGSFHTLHEIAGVRCLPNESTKACRLLFGAPDVADLEPLAIPSAQPLRIRKASANVNDAVVAALSPLAELGIPDTAQSALRQRPRERLGGSPS